MSIVYIGTYTRGPLSGRNRKSQGIYRATFDAVTGALSAVELAVACDNPSYLALHPAGRVLYAVNEVDDFGGERSGAVSAFGVGAAGELRLLGQVSSHGADPCHLSISRSGRLLFVANYHGGNVSSYHIGDDGRLRDAGVVFHQGSGPHPNQGGPHPHYVAQGPEGESVYVADLGVDKVFAYRVDEATGQWTAAATPFAATRSGGGPRHLAFHPNRRVVYVNYELSSEVGVFSHDARSGVMRELQTIGTLPAGFDGKNDNAEIAVTPDGRFVFVSNRGSDCVARFAVDGADGRLTALGHVATGACPRDFKLDPGGRFLLVENQRADSIVVMRLDRDTGALEPTGNKLSVPTPVCLVFP